MEQVEIIRRTREIFEKIGEMPLIREVDPLATHTEVDVVDLANRLLETDREMLTEEEQGLRGFFTGRAWRLFAISMLVEYVSASLVGCLSLTVLPIRPSSGPPANAQPLSSSDARALQILNIEQTLPWIRFSPELHSTLEKFFTSGKT
jgi:hypothetical protein